MCVCARIAGQHHKRGACANKFTIKIQHPACPEDIGQRSHSAHTRSAIINNNKCLNSPFRQIYNSLRRMLRREARVRLRVYHHARPICTNGTFVCVLCTRAGHGLANVRRLLFAIQLLDYANGKYVF